MIYLMTESDDETDYYQFNSIITAIYFIEKYKISYWVMKDEPFEECSLNEYETPLVL